MAKVPNAVEILRKITTASVVCTSVTDREIDDRWRTGDSIANVNVSSRSLKSKEKNRTNNKNRYSSEDTVRVKVCEVSSEPGRDMLQK